VTPALSLHAWLRWGAIAAQLRRAADVRTVLELGVGLGSVGLLLARRFEYTGVEPDATSFATAKARFARARLGEVIHGDASALAADRTFDLVCAFEVLEHLADDGAAIRSWAQLVRPGGWLLLSVPANRARWGATDVKAGHYRRYDRGELARLLAASGLVDCSEMMYGFPAGYALEAGRNAIVRRRLDSEESLGERTAASGRWLQPPEWAAPAMWGLALPLRAAQRPFRHSTLGTGLVGLARRPS
jgi:SAM-dependent methyltransferase